MMQPTKDNSNGKIFNLTICKNDDIDSEGLQQSDTDYDSLIDLQSLNTNTNQSSNVPVTTVSVIADFGQNFLKRFYNKKTISLLTNDFIRR